jgi:hypothetical protein
VVINPGITRLTFTAHAQNDSTTSILRLVPLRRTFNCAGTLSWQRVWERPPMKTSRLLFGWRTGVNIIG